VFLFISTIKSIRRSLFATSSTSETLKGIQELIIYTFSHFCNEFYRVITLLQYRCMSRINICIGLYTYIFIYNYVYLIPVQECKYSIFNFVEVRIEEIQVPEVWKLISYTHVCRFFDFQFQ
jgi:hypothetical protein